MDQSKGFPPATDLPALQAQLLEAMDGFGRKFFKGDDVLVQMIHAVSREGEHHLIACPWQDAESRDAIIGELRRLFYEKGVVAYAMVAEVWIANYDRASAPIMPKDREDRREAVIVVSCAAGLPPLARQREIIRPMDGSPAHLGEPDDLPDALSLGGELLNLLQTREVAHAAG